jgi:phosphoribosylglycinamide formyltransferase 1
MINIAIFASGNGSNAGRIMGHFHLHPRIRVALILSDHAEAFVLKRAEKANIPAKLFTRKELHEGTVVNGYLKQHQIDFIVLAGFLLKVPVQMIRNYENRMVNIHPALLPAYGGKGMYGMHVHREVIRNRDNESGITIHFINERYDEGKIIFQKRCNIDEMDTPESLAEKIHVLEHLYFPQVIEEVVLRCFPEY